jgi:hypothetical protein
MDCILISNNTKLDGLKKVKLDKEANQHNYCRKINRFQKSRQVQEVVLIVACGLSWPPKLPPMRVATNFVEKTASLR